jgi:hypothetical protein
MTSAKEEEWWLRAPDLVHFGLALGIGGFLGSYRPGFWWTLGVAVVVAVPLAVVTSLISTLRASAYLRAHGVPSELQRSVLRPGFWPRFGGTITTILVTAGIVSLFR